ncbi:MAG: 1-acyl-sn-glycerol-3-phosphate acyltransferase [Firmicutes bacterium]|nr:1-acyl-sn-glycerol-3-phosphate acyltransferase [Bacillota bacterium]
MNRIALMVSRNLTKVPGAWFKLCRYAKSAASHPEQEQERYDHIRYMLTLAVTTGNINLQITGLENLPEQDGFLIYANHQGLFDCVALVYACPRPLAAVCKKELKGIPFVQQVIDCTKSFLMDRDDARQSLSVIQEVTKEVASGRNYVIFPEGTRSRDGNKIQEFHGGSFRAAIKAKKPVVPVAVVDTHKVFDTRGSEPVSAQLHFLPAIESSEFEGMKAQELADLVKARIEEAVSNSIS